MIIKHADSREADLEELNSLLALPFLKPWTKNQISQEIKNIKSGIGGENEAAYHINFNYGKSKNWAVIHDLRLEYDGQSAQIDHLIISRFLEIYVCESKNLSEAININEHGEFWFYKHGKKQGIPSPIEQNNRHINVLKKVLQQDQADLPTRLGVRIQPKFINLVLVANSCHISRPKNQKNIKWLDEVIKMEQIKKKIQKDTDTENILLAAVSMAKVILSDTLQSFAQSLAALHKPAHTNWRARFGISDSPEATAAARPTLSEMPAAVTQTTVAATSQVVGTNKTVPAVAPVPAAQAAEKLPENHTAAAVPNTQPHTPATHATVSDNTPNAPATHTTVSDNTPNAPATHATVSDNTPDAPVENNAVGAQTASAAPEAVSNRAPMPDGNDARPTAGNPPPRRFFCAACGATVSQKVAYFCWNNKVRFQGKVYCYNCQKQH